MRNTLIIGWIFAIASLFTIVAGHFGNHALSWKVNQISTYAATAPYDYLITISMLLSVLTLVIVAVLISKHKIFGSSYFIHLIPIISGAAASGLIMLASYEETAKSFKILKQSNFWAIRVQSFHDAGLETFFFGSLILIGLIGISAIIIRTSLIEKIIGIFILILSPASYLLMRTSWPKMIGFTGITVGINQRASLFCLWLAMVLFLIIASINANSTNAKKNAWLINKIM